MQEVALALSYFICRLVCCYNFVFVLTLSFLTSFIIFTLATLPKCFYGDLVNLVIDDDLIQRDGTALQMMWAPSLGMITSPIDLIKDNYRKRMLVVYREMTNCKQVFVILPIVKKQKLY